jgi:hypothetical protein
MKSSQGVGRGVVGDVGTLVGSADGSSVGPSVTMGVVGTGAEVGDEVAVGDGVVGTPLHSSQQLQSTSQSV